MLEFFRRHRGPFMITITVIIIISFSYWGGSTRGAGLRGKESHDTAFTIYNRDYTFHDMDRLGRAQQLCYYLQMYDLAFSLPDAAKQLQPMPGQRGPDYDFVANLLVLREKALEHGVAVSDADAKKRLETLRPFQKDGKFDAATASEMEDRLKANGFSTGDLLELVKDQIAYERLQDLVGANYSPSTLSVGKAYAATHQTIKASTVSLALEDFKKKVEVKDDEISKYFEEKKETYKSAEKRAATYVVFEKPKPDEKKKAEENQKAQTDFETLVNDFDMKFKAPGADFNAVVAEFQKRAPTLKAQTIAAFEQGTPPEAIKDESKVVSEIFRDTLTVGHHSEPVEGTKGYYFLKLTQLDAPKQQELKDVKDKIKDVLVTQKAQEALMKAANEARTTIQDGIKAGKKLEDLAKAGNWKVEALPEFVPSNPPPGNPNGQQIATDAAATPVNGVAKPISTDTGALLVVVTAKELRKSEQSTALKQSEESQQASRAKTELFKAWFTKERNAAKMTLAQN